MKIGIQEWDWQNMTEIIEFSSEIGRKLTIRTFKNIEYSSRYKQGKFQ